jgi:hypothetical protein
MLRDPAKLAFFTAVRQAKQSLPDGGKEKASTSKACLTAVKKRAGGHANIILYFLLKYIYDGTKKKV